MGEDRPSLPPNFTQESAELVRSLLQRRRHTVPKEGTDDCPSRDMKDISWVSNKDFTIAVGEKQIGEYILTWDIAPCWLYSVDFLYTTEEEHHTFHHYRARFSTPTPRRPIQGTASVYFVVDVSKVKPRSLPVEVRFVMESNRLVHTPGKTRFTEKWLLDIIESKTLLVRDLWTS